MEVRRVVRQIVGVGSVAVPDRFVDGVGGRGALPDTVDEHFPGRRAPSIDRVARIGREVRAIHVLQGGNIVDHVGLVAASVGIRIDLVARADIGIVVHDRPLGRIMIRRQRAVSGALIGLAVLQTQRMADLMHDRVECIVRLDRNIVADVAVPDVAACIISVRIVGVGGTRKGRTGKPQHGVRRIGFRDFRKCERRVFGDETEGKAHDIPLRGDQCLPAAERIRVVITVAVVRGGAGKAEGDVGLVPGDAAQQPIDVLVDEIARRSDRCRGRDRLHRTVHAVFDVRVERPAQIRAEMEDVCRRGPGHPRVTGRLQARGAEMPGSHRGICNIARPRSDGITAARIAGEIIGIGAPYGQEAIKTRPVAEAPGEIGNIRPQVTGPETFCEGGRAKDIHRTPHSPDDRSRITHSGLVG